MSDTESNPDYPTPSRNLFDKPVEYAALPELSPTTPTNPFEIPLPLDKE
jgi:hypothetical protein